MQSPQIESNIGIKDIHKYFKDRISEISDLAKRGDPWVFLCCSAFIDYLVRATFNKEAKSNDYKEFIIQYLSLIDVRYNDFEFKNGAKDLPDQMYHILRCGIIHSFSLIPDDTSLRKGGRKRSILLAHTKNGATHFDSYTENGYDSVIFTAETYASDIEKLIDVIFKDVVVNNSRIEENIKSWWSKYTPIHGYIYKKNQPISSNT
jgi:hypothetical protein